MNPEHFAILGYIVGLTVLWGYAASVLLAHRALDKREKGGGRE